MGTAKKTMRLVIATVLHCIGLMPAPAAANLVQNGDFSTDDLTGISGNYAGHMTLTVRSSSRA